MDTTRGTLPTTSDNPRDERVRGFVSEGERLPMPRATGQCAPPRPVPMPLSEVATTSAPSAMAAGPATRGTRTPARRPRPVPTRPVGRAGASPPTITPVSAWLIAAAAAAGEALRQGERRADEAERTREKTARRRVDDTTPPRGLDDVQALVDDARTTGLNAALTIEGQRHDVPAAVDRGRPGTHSRSLRRRPAQDDTGRLDPGRRQPRVAPRPRHTLRRRRDQQRPGTLAVATSSDLPSGEWHGALLQAGACKS